jgi:hypothetical protein
MKTQARTSFLASALVVLATLLGHITYEVDAFVVNSSRSQNVPIRSAGCVGGASSSPASCSHIFPVRSLMVAKKNHENMKKKSIGVVIPWLMQASVQRLQHLPHAWSRCQSQLIVKLRRSLVILSMAACLWLGVSGISALPAYASSSEATLVPTNSVVTAAPPTMGSAAKTSNLFSKSIDEIVTGYVKHHMFDDDVYDPVESTYREALADQTQGTYPRSLSEVASSVFGQGGVKTVAKPNSSTVTSASSSSGGGLSMGTLLTIGITFLQKRVGLSESTAIFVLASAFVVAGPVAFLMGGMIVGGASKRQMNKVFKQRYGDTYRYVWNCCNDCQCQTS